MTRSQKHRPFLRSNRSRPCTWRAQFRIILRNSDAVLVGYERSHGSVGTPMEVLYAFERDKPVSLCIQDDTMHHEIPAWYRYHATAQVSAPRLALRHLCLEVQRKRTTDGGGE